MTDDQSKQLDQLLDIEEGLTKSEVEFIEGLHRRRSLFPNYILTPDQSVRLMGIWERLCG